MVKVSSWIKITPGVITGYFKGKRIAVKQNDIVTDADLVKIYPQDFKPVSPPTPSSLSLETEPQRAPLFTKEELEKLNKKELIEIAKKLNINTEGLKKEELIEVILKENRNE